MKLGLLQGTSFSYGHILGTFVGVMAFHNESNIPLHTSWERK
jgi:hypothetical protein